MANRYMQQFRYSLEQELTDLYGQFNIGAAGAVTAGTVKGGGILSVVKEATAGQYTITLEDKWYRLMGFNANVINATLTGVASVSILAAPATYQSGFVSSKSFVIQLADYAGAAVNAPSGSQLQFHVEVRNTANGIWD